MNKLPNTVTISINDLDYVPEDNDELSELISDYLSDTYGYCHFGFDYETDIMTGDITVDNINWDTSD